MSVQRQDVRPAVSIKLDAVLTVLCRPDGLMWTHTALSQAFLDHGLAVSPDQVTQMRSGALSVPPRVRSALGLIMMLPAEFWLDSTPPTRAGYLLDVALAPRAVTTPAPLTDLADRLRRAAQ